MGLFGALLLMSIVLTFKKVISTIDNAFLGYENSQNNKFIEFEESVLLLLATFFLCGFVGILFKTLPAFEVFQSQSSEIQLGIAFIIPLIGTYLVSVFSSKQAVNYGLKNGLIKKTDVKK